MKRYVHFRKDIAGVIAIIVAGVLVLGLLFYMNFKNNSNSLNFMYEKTTIPLSDIVFIAQNYQRMRAILSMAVIDPSPDNLKVQKEKYEELYTRFLLLDNEYARSLINQEDKVLFEKYKVLKNEYHEFAMKVFEQLKAGKTGSAVLLMKTEGVTRSDGFRDIIEKLTNFNIDSAKNMYNLYTSTNNTYLMIMIVISISAILVSSILVYFGSKSIKTLLVDMKNKIEAVSSETINERTEIKPPVVKIDPENILLPDQPFDLSELTDNIVKKTMLKFNGNKTKTAEYLGLSRIQLYRRYK